jgi:hypothetical protein
MTTSWEYPVPRGRVMRAVPLSEPEMIMFGRRLAAWQVLHGLGNGEVAEWLGMSRFRLSRLRNGLLTRVTRDEAAHIARRLGMSAYGTSVECTPTSEQVARQVRELHANAGLEP